MSDINSKQEELASQWKQLQQQWEVTRQQWQDAVGNRFENEFWQSLGKGIPQLLKSLATLDEAVDRISRLD